jgi:hypothetical protein
MRFERKKPEQVPAPDEEDLGHFVKEPPLEQAAKGCDCEIAARSSLCAVYGAGTCLWVGFCLVRLRMRASCSVSRSASDFLPWCVRGGTVNES